MQFVLQNMDFEKLKEVIPKFLDEARQDPTFSNVDVNLKFNRPEIQLSVDRMKAKDLGLSTEDIVAAIQAALMRLCRAVSRAGIEFILRGGAKTASVYARIR